MIRKALLASALAAGAMIGSAPAQATVNLGTIGGLINQLQNNSFFSPNNMQFTICTNGVCQTLFTGLTGLHGLGNLNTFNNWAGTGNGGNTGGYFDNYQFTFTGLGSFFGDNTPPPPQIQTFDVLDNEPAVPEPATWAMMILGFAIIGIAARRRKTTVINFG